MDKLTAIKIKYDDGTYSDKIPVGVLSENVEWDSTHTLVDVLGSIDVDVKGTIQDQIDKLSNNTTQLTNVLGNIDVKADGTVQDQIKKLSNEKVSNTQLTDVLGNVGTLQDQIDKLSAQGAGAHNSIYRGKDLGTSVTYKQWAAINAGTFDDLYIGDYWEINGVAWRIAAFDYYLHTGDTECIAHHVVIVPDADLYTAKMNDTDTTEGGYVGSAMYKSNLAQAGTAIESAFGAAHILSHRNYLTNAVSNGAPSGGAWFDRKWDLMTERNVYGNSIFATAANGVTEIINFSVDKSQFPLFAYRPDTQSVRHNWYWLRDVASSVSFAGCDSPGNAGYSPTSNTFGVRPAFCIY